MDVCDLMLKLTAGVHQPILVPFMAGRMHAVPLIEPPRPRSRGRIYRTCLARTGCGRVDEKRTHGTWGLNRGLSFMQERLLPMGGAKLVHDFFVRSKRASHHNCSHNRASATSLRACSAVTL